MKASFLEFFERFLKSQEMHSVSTGYAFTCKKGVRM